MTKKEKPKSTTVEQSKVKKQDNLKTVSLPKSEIKIPEEAPKTAYEFEKNFKELKGEHFHKYLKVCCYDTQK